MSVAAAGFRASSAQVPRSSRRVMDDQLLVREGRRGAVALDDHPDQRNAAMYAEHFTASGVEAELLLKFARQRTAGMVETPRFQALCGALVRPCSNTRR
jgi:hypothetical protein